MDIEILRDEPNKILNRREVDFKVKHRGSATPSLKDVRSAIAAKLSISEDGLVVKDYITHSGASTTKGRANIYKTRKEIIDSAHFIKRNFKEEPKTEEAPASEEKPAEEKKEGESA